ncbi:MAG: DUF2330 domain-containing protein [Myxococcales bacterium]|jgi:MYXO-CTERM domain-containing protein
MHFENLSNLGLAVATAGLIGAVAAPAPAHACGGFFCSAANPVNQAAEQIIFVDNPDGTVTAVIQIMYEGPSESFAWVLPVPGVPDVEVSSDQALDRLKQATNPLYQLNTVFDGECGFFPSPVAAAGGDFAVAEDGGGGVMVQAEAQVGPYDYVVISVDPTLDDAAQVATDWLTENGYDVTDLGPDVLRPYLDDGLNLVAFRLTKGNDSGSIRPVMLTYESDSPMIPIRPTAVAANDDMGVLVWVLGSERAIPENYKGLVLNEALIDWFNPNNNYNEVVSAAADEAGGQGFVTEFAGDSSAFENTILVPWETSNWESFSSQNHTDPTTMIRDATNNFGGWDGFDDALRASVTLPDGVDYGDFKLCIACYTDEAGFALDTDQFLQNLFELVYKPMLDTQELINSRPYMTRLYTTMSAEEMTIDPVFDFNPDLDDVDNFHQVDRVVRCDDANVDPNSQPWSVALPQGDTVEGTEFGVWPIAMDEQPAARQILQFATSGEPEMVMDLSDMVSDMVDDTNADTMSPDSGDDGVVADAGVMPNEGATGNGGLGTDSMGGAGELPGEGDGSGSGSSGCAVGGSPSGAAAGWLAVLGMLLTRRRRRR